MTFEQRLDSIDTRIERLASIMEASDQRFNQKLEALAEQMNRTDERFNQKLEALAEQMNRTDERLNQKLEILTEQAGRFTEGLTAVNLTAERQERNIDRLVGIVETLIQRN